MKGVLNSVSMLSEPPLVETASAGVAAAAPIKAAKITGRIEALDYLRGLLALSVMFYHYKGWSGMHLGYPFEQIFQRLGVYAVCTFYALSGTSLGIVYAPRKVDTAFLVEFGIKRLFRIAPLFWTATTLTILIHWMLMPRLGLDVAGMPSHPILLAGADYSLLFGWLRPDAYVPVGGWSIGAEMVFYSLFPGFLVLMRPSRWKPVVVFASTLAAGLVFTFFLIDRNAELGSSGQWPFYINPVNHLFLFVGGMGLAILWGQTRRISPRWVVTGIMLCIVIFVFWPTHELGGSVLVTGWERPLFGGISLALCYLALCWPFRFGRFASLFVWIGNISYAVYLLHPIVGDICSVLNSKLLRLNPLLVSCTLGMPLTLVCATYSWKYLEKPLMRFGRQLADSILPRPDSVRAKKPFCGVGAIPTTNRE